MCVIFLGGDVCYNGILFLVRPRQRVFGFASWRRTLASALLWCHHSAGIALRRFCLVHTCSHC